MRLFCILLSGILITGCLSTIEYSETFKPITRENSIFEINTITSDFYKSSMAKAESGVFIENVEFQSNEKGFEGQYFVALLSTLWYWNREMIPIDASDVISNFYGIDFPPGKFGQKTEIRNDYREFHFWKVDQPRKNCIVFANESVIANISSNKRSHSYGYFCEDKTIAISNADRFMEAIMKLRRKDNSYNGRGLRFWESG